MIYRQTINVERIALSSLDNINSTQFVELIKYGDVPMFAVYMNNGEDVRYWEFDMSEPSDYERVKMNMYDAIFECDTMEELGEALNSIFEDGFATILVDEDHDDEYDGDFMDEDADWNCDGDEDEEDDDDVGYFECGCCRCPNRRFNH